jgi:hypothetical protein
VRLSGLQIDWCGDARKPFIELDPDELSKEGIFLRSHLSELSLVELARAADLAVVPAGTLDSSDIHDWLARARIPSRIIYLMATANVPIIVMGHPETAAAKFVLDLGLGTICDYTPGSFQNAVKQVTNSAASAQIRQRAKSLSPSFSSRELFEHEHENEKKPRETRSIYPPEKHKVLKRKISSLRAFGLLQKSSFVGYKPGPWPSTNHLSPIRHAKCLLRATPLRFPSPRSTVCAHQSLLTSHVSLLTIYLLP